MIDFHVPDMSCGHCVRAIGAALQACDSQARFDIDLGTHRVHITQAQADAATLAAAIREAGYTPEPMAASEQG